MADTYKGESPGKKVARLDFWTRVAAARGGSLKGTSKILVLASRYGGDIGVCLALGADPKSIVAVDLDADAAAACRDRWPSIDVRHGDAADVAALIRPDVAFLDFCAPLCRDVARTVARVGRVMGRTVGRTLGVAVLKGRERNTSTKEDLGDLMGAPLYGSKGSAKTRDHIRRWTAQMFSGECSARDYGALIGVGQYGNDNDSPSGKRIGAILLSANHHGHTSRFASVSFQFRFGIEYHSRTSGGHGVPMLIAALRTVPLPQKSSGAWRASTGMGKINDGATVVTATEDDVRALALADPLGAMKYGVSDGTIAAWRAHATRGTYARAS